MRDLIVLAMVVVAAPVCLVRPYFGVLLWFWISVIPPSSYAYGFGSQIPTALIVATPTLIATIFAARNRRFLPKQMVLFFLFWVWIIITYLCSRQEPLFADHIEAGLTELVLVSKILVMTVVTILLVDSKEKLRYVLLVTTAALGVLATKGAIWGILTGGNWKVYGSPGSFIGDNNDFALALNMSLGVVFFLARETTNRKLRFVLRFLFCADLVCIVLSYSRGGLLALGVAMAAIAVKSRHKVLAGLLLIVTVYGVITFTSAEWKDRMEGFLHGKVDDSAEQRLITWGYAWNLAKAYPLTGGGFECWTPGLFARFQPRELGDGKLALGPHSIYFQVLGEHGFPGLLLFLLLLFSCWFSVRRIRRAARGQPGLAWVENYSHAIEIGFLAYVVGGAFLGRAYFDLYFELIACSVILCILYKRAVNGAEEATTELAESGAYADDSEAVASMAPQF